MVEKRIALQHSGGGNWGVRWQEVVLLAKPAPVAFCLRPSLAEISTHLYCNPSLLLVLRQNPWGSVLMATNILRI